MRTRTKEPSIATFCLVGLCLPLAVALVTGCTSPPPGLTVSGIVTDATRGQPIGGAKVSDDGYGPKPYKGAVTDASGMYTYTTWTEEHFVKAEAGGYRPQRQILTTGFFQRDREKTIDFALVRE
jgi:hypothetical protein